MNLNDKVSAELLTDLKKYGDRTSSFMTLYPGFESYKSDNGLVRYMETTSAWVAGTEPLAPAEKKIDVFNAFKNSALNKRKNAIVAPVTEEFSKELTKAGFHRIQIGSDPVFDLTSYFSTIDPVHRFPSARSLQKRGAVVRELAFESMTQEQRDRILMLVKAWKNTKKTAPFGFLNQIDPFYFANEKKFFVLELHGRILAFLAAVPVFALEGYFFSEYMRAAESRVGTTELLFIETMRLLKKAGYKEVRLGTCLFSNLRVNSESNLRQRVMSFAMGLAFRHLRYPLNFKSIYQFKAKFEPTRWEPVYLASKSKVGIRVLFDVLRVHFKELNLGARLQGYFAQGINTRALPKTFGEFLYRSKITFIFSAIFVVLHLWRTFSTTGLAFFQKNGYSVSGYSASGHFWSPLFHNGHTHFFGDLSTFLIFGTATEVFLGSWFAASVIAFGLWASNPQAVYIVEKLIGPNIDAATLARFRSETDYGSSNAIYAMVGALSGLLKRPMLLMLPFILNGLFLCIALKSILSIHHLTALFTGFVICKLLHIVQKKFPTSVLEQSKTE